MNPSCDVLVAGAGPAGSAAALALSRAGRRVMLLDERTFPRDKPCGDLLGTDAIGMLRSLELSHLASDGCALDGARVYGPSGRFAGALRGAAGNVVSAARVIAREVFDARLVAAARAAGADFVNERVRTVVRDDGGGWTVETSQGTHSAPVVIGADGYGSRVASAAGRRPAESAHLAIVVRGYADGTCGLDNAMHFYVNARSDGYGWIFPLGSSRANVGLGFVAGDLPHRPDVHAAFARFVGAGGPIQRFLASATLTNVRAWPIPLGWDDGRVAAPGLFLAGDAASLASPLSGSGIYHALRSGTMAATAAMRHLDGDVDAHERYGRELAARFAPRLRVERAMRAVAGVPARVEPYLSLAHLLPFGDRALARALLALG